jgi:hypothetical protein
VHSDDDTETRPWHTFLFEMLIAVLPGMLCDHEPVRTSLRSPYERSDMRALLRSASHPFGYDNSACRCAHAGYAAIGCKIPGALTRP